MPSSALIFTVVGTGEAGYTGDRDVARRAALNQPFDIALDQEGNLYFSEAHNHCVRRVERRSGLIITVAGTGQEGYSGDGGPATQAQLNSPYGIALDAANNLYIVDRLNACIRLVEATTGVIRTIAGTGQEGYSGDGGPAPARYGTQQRTAINVRHTPSYRMASVYTQVFLVLRGLTGCTERDSSSGDS